VTTALIAQEALKELAQERYDVLVVDLESTSHEGWRMLTTLQGRPAPPAIVALLSAESCRCPEVQALTVGLVVPPAICRERLLTGVKAALMTADDAS
jgi:DNA-binding response OmpR family regulator